MQRDTSNVARRDVLAAVGGTAVAGTGTVAAAPDAVEVNVGYDADAGRRAAREAAAAVVREFAFDALTVRVLTVRVPESARADLAAHPDVRYVESDGEVYAVDHETTWSYDRLDADAARANGYTGRGVDVSIIDICTGESGVLSDAVGYAYSRGVFLAGAAGNDGPCIDCVCYPAAYDGVVAVSATDRDDSLADFSSTGPEAELAAPGVDVTSTVPGGHDTRSGTSTAAPHVAGAAGLVMAEAYSHEEARQRLRDTAEDLGLSYSEQGAGLVDAAAAVGLE